MEGAIRDGILGVAVDNELDMNIIGEAANALIVPIRDDDEPQERENRARNRQFFEVTVPMYTDDLFKEHFRMSRRAFQEELWPQRIDFRKKILFSVWTIAKQESFLAVGDRFDCGKSTGHGIYSEFVLALAGLVNEYIRFPNQNAFLTSAETFQERSRGFPGVVGAIDGCHIPIKQPEGNEHDYYNRKGFHSIILQATCDHKGKIIECYIGSPGRMHDARVLRNSPLYRRLVGENPLLPPNFHIIGDCAYPLLQNLMTPYRDTGHLTENQVRYNMKLSAIRSIIERVFGILKAKFRRLKFLDISDPDFGSQIIAAACVLYNFLIIERELNFDEEPEDGNPQNIDDQEDNVLQNENVVNLPVVKRDNICAGL